MFKLETIYLDLNDQRSDLLIELAIKHQFNVKLCIGINTFLAETISNIYPFNHQLVDIVFINNNPTVRFHDHTLIKRWLVEQADCLIPKSSNQMSFTKNLRYGQAQVDELLNINKKIQNPALICQVNNRLEIMAFLHEYAIEKLYINLNLLYTEEIAEYLEVLDTILTVINAQFND